MKSTLSNLPIARPVMGDEELAAVRSVLESGWLTQGLWVRRLEEGFAARHGVPHAVATTSCTTALHLALTALGVGPGDEVIVPAFTWVATANVVVHCGALPVFADVLPDSYNIDPNAVARALTPRTKAVIVVHLFGQCADMDRLRSVVPPHVHLIEDAACAAGAAYDGMAAGGLGTVGCFSFHPRKTITCGEGGMVTTRNPVLAERLQCLRNHGASIPEEVRHRGPRPFDLPAFAEAGFNYRMTDLQAAVATVQLGRLDAFLAERRTLAALYHEALAGIPWLAPPVPGDRQDHAWQAYVCLIDASAAPLGRDALMEHLHERGIASRPGTHAVTRLDAYRNRAGVASRPFPVADRLDGWTLALPLYNGLLPGDIGRVVETLRRIG